MSPSPPTWRKVKDLIIYEDARFYAAFPSVVRRPDGEVLVAFRRAPDRRIWGQDKITHVDPNSYLVLVRSRDGETWTKEPELIYADAIGGSQDPCLLQLRDGTLLCASYGWTFIPTARIAQLKQPVFSPVPDVVFNGGYLVKSNDGGRTWQGPVYPPRIPTEILLDPYGKPLPAYNRGAMVEGRDGRIFWVCAAHETAGSHHTNNHLLISEDKGQSWRYSCPVATDARISFNETSIYETPAGDLVAFLRTADFDDEACIARSTDGGKSFQPWQGMGFQGHPLQALRLPDDRVLLVYGYRHEPFGIRARILNAECTDYATAPEMILRDDAGTGDIGYPWSVQLDATHVLVTYYYNLADGPRHIAGTMLELA
ncbi:MAG: glycoside hydrolase [Cephaloticoccus sp.]|nr:glycoside hydrolase [Cephaloticoccus sp.]MCF7759369.1 glycoside hydrolase [Cephaloticoccus sp.]